MHFDQLLDALYLDDYGILDDQIGPVANLELDSLVDDGHPWLSSKSQAPVRELEAEAFFVGRLEQSGSQLTVHADGRPDDLMGERVLL